MVDCIEAYLANDKRKERNWHCAKYRANQWETCVYEWL